MKKIAIIGLGNFGTNIALTLINNKCDVLGIDSNIEIINSMKDVISYAVAADATNKEILESLNLNEFDAAVVSIGQDMASSILISLYLKEIGVKRVVTRAISEDHAKVLTHLKIDDIIFPEKDMAIKIANKLSLKNAMDYLPISDEYGIVEVAPPDEFVNKTLAELKITARFNCQIIGIKYISYSDTDKLSEEVIKTKIAPSAKDIITKNSIMIVLGKLADIERLQSGE